MRGRNALKPFYRTIIAAGALATALFLAGCIGSEVEIVTNDDAAVLLDGADVLLFDGGADDDPRTLLVRDGAPNDRSYLFVRGTYVGTMRFYRWQDQTVLPDEELYILSIEGAEAHKDTLEGYHYQLASQDTAGRWTRWDPHETETVSDLARLKEEFGTRLTDTTTGTKIRLTRHAGGTLRAATQTEIKRMDRSIAALRTRIAELRLEGERQRALELAEQERVLEWKKRRPEIVRELSEKISVAFSGSDNGELEFTCPPPEWVSANALSQGDGPFQGPRIGLRLCRGKANLRAFPGFADPDEHPPKRVNGFLETEIVWEGDWDYDDSYLLSCIYSAVTESGQTVPVVLLADIDFEQGCGLTDIQDYATVRVSGDRWKTEQIEDDSLYDEDLSSLYEVERCEGLDPADCIVVFVKPNDDAIEAMVSIEPP
jgi:hypothetical protein